eukprot:365100-Chlamydomonas_euryale.AAC.9
MPGGHVQWSCQVVMPGGHAQWSCPVVMPSGHARWSRPVVMPGGHAQWSCPVVMPRRRGVSCACVTPRSAAHGCRAGCRAQAPCEHYTAMSYQLSRAGAVRALDGNVDILCRAWASSQL